jgi:hypothetical protein
MDLRRRDLYDHHVVVEPLRELFLLAWLTHARRAAHADEHLIRGLASLGEHVPGVVTGDVVGHYPAIVETDVCLAIARPHPEERRIFLADVRR